MLSQLPAPLLLLSRRPHTNIGFISFIVSFFFLHKHLNAWMTIACGWQLRFASSNSNREQFADSGRGGPAHSWLPKCPLSLLLKQVASKVWCCNFNSGTLRLFLFVSRCFVLVYGLLPCQEISSNTEVLIVSSGFSFHVAQNQNKDNHSFGSLKVKTCTSCQLFPQETCQLRRATGASFAPQPNTVLILSGRTSGSICVASPRSPSKDFLLIR